MSLERSLYRALFRAIPFSVRHNKAATANVRRSLRREFQSVPQDDLVDYTEKRLLLLLSASQQPDPPSSSNSSILPHRLVQTISDLTYHHFSHDVYMQTRKRQGGSNSASLRRKRGRLPSASSSSSLEAGEGPPPVDRVVLSSLSIPAKPPRGPKMGPPDNKGSVRLRGAAKQNVEKLHEMDARIEELMEKRREQGGKGTMTSEQEEYHKLKGERKATKKLVEQSEIKSRPLVLLHDLLQGATFGGIIR